MRSVHFVISYCCEPPFFLICHDLFYSTFAGGCEVHTWRVLSTLNAKWFYNDFQKQQPAFVLVRMSFIVDQGCVHPFQRLRATWCRGHICTGRTNYRFPHVDPPPPPSCPCCIPPCYVGIPAHFPPPLHTPPRAPCCVPTWALCRFPCLQGPDLWASRLCHLAHRDPRGRASQRREGKPRGNSSQSNVWSSSWKGVWGLHVGHRMPFGQPCLGSKIKKERYRDKMQG